MFDSKRVSGRVRIRVRVRVSVSKQRMWYSSDWGATGSARRASSNHWGRLTGQVNTHTPEVMNRLGLGLGYAGGHESFRVRARARIHRGS